MAKRFIAIAGNIGSGKSTLTQLLSEKYGWDPYYEVVKENPYLADFYSDMRRWSLPLQIYFLSKRFQAHQAILASARSSVQDRSIYEDVHIFARTLHESGDLDARDFGNYHDLYQTMTSFLSPPDIIVYIRRSVECLKSRIKERGRTYEKNIPESYLTLLNRCYDDWMTSYSLGKVLIVQADNLDLKWKPKDFNYVCDKIESSLEQPDLKFEC